MLGSLLVALLCGTAAALIDPSLDDHWMDWKLTHGKFYHHQVLQEACDFWRT